MILKDVIAEKIKEKGPLNFEDFMKMALYYPDLGYYTRRDIKIGQEGDFFTASHLGNVFGLILSKKIRLLWEELGKPENFKIIEIGPGMGYLAMDILDSLKKGELYGFSNYFLLEINPSLIEVQKKKLEEHIEKVRWFSSLKDLEPFEGVVICNEIFDAFGVRLFEIKDGICYEIYIDLDGDGNFSEVFLPCGRDVIEYLEEFAPEVFSFRFYRSEVNLKMRSFLQELSEKLLRGYLMVFDYGYDAKEYYHPERKRGTLLCYYKHSVHENPYINVGLQDITSHVNFTALEKWAKEVGFVLEIFTSQSKFLFSLCDEEMLNDIYRKGLIQHFKRLILPQGMGETHKVVVLKKLP